MINTKRISDNMEQALIAQMTKEANAAQIYLSYGSWADAQGFGGVADFMFKHAHEERNHMMKVLKYVNTRGGYCKVGGVPSPPPDPESVLDLFEKALQHEFDNTEAIYNLVNLAQQEKDWATFNFAQWFVKEQIEEETLIMNMLDKYKLASRSATEIYEFDKNIASASQEADMPQDATEGDA